MQNWSCTSSHATPSEIERREFCNGILMLSQKQMWMITLASARLWGNSTHLVYVAVRSMELQLALCGFIYSVPSGIQEVLSFPFPKSNVCTCPVDPLHRPASVSSDTIPIPAYSSVNVLFRHTACLQSESLLVLVDREPCDRVCRF